MTTIQITEFKGYTTAMIHEFLQASWPCFFKVVLPKSSTLEQGRVSIFNDMMMADHLSNSLYHLSSEVLCSMPEPALEGSFAFLVMTDDLGSLASLLAQYANGYEGQLPGQALFDEVVLQIGYRDMEWSTIPHYLQASEQLLMKDAAVDMSLYFG